MRGFSQPTAHRPSLATDTRSLGDVVTYLHVGDSVGEGALLHARDRNASARCVVRTECCVVARADFVKLLESLSPSACEPSKAGDEDQVSMLTFQPAAAKHELVEESRRSVTHEVRIISTGGGGPRSAGGVPNHDVAVHFRSIDQKPVVWMDAASLSPA